MMSDDLATSVKSRRTVNVLPLPHLILSADADASRR